MVMMISWVKPVNPSHPYLENDPLRRLTPNICAFHLGFSLVLQRRIFCRIPDAWLFPSKMCILRLLRQPLRSEAFPKR